ncbi:hypothetical protein QWZ08_16315 [Ferruginibacter paludis]|nr:hypothetical protein [Ferruginibacter paludis]
MPDLQELDTQTLIDMLAQQTVQLTEIIVEKGYINIEQQEYELSLIQAELNKRLSSSN